MPKCSRCGKRGLFLKLYNSLCDDCMEAIREQQKKEKRTEKTHSLSENASVRYKQTAPRLSMITDYQRRKPSDQQLRLFLHSISTDEYENIFMDCGFPFDDGKRIYLPYEADDKAAFYSDRLWEKAGDCKRWIRDCTSPDVFQKYYDQYIDVLQKLKFFEAYISFHDPLPSAQLTSLKEDRKSLEKNFIKRAWEAELRKCQKLSTESGRREHLHNFFASFESVSSYFSTDSMDYIEKLKIDAETLQKKQIEVPAKPEPIFDQNKEAQLLSEYKSARGHLEKHFARIPLISFYYKFRHDPKYLDVCESLCQEDLDSLPYLDQQTRERAKESWDRSVSLFGETESRKKVYEDAMKKGFVGQISAFDKLIMINLNRGDLEKAIYYCDMAEKHYEQHFTPDPSYQKKRIKIQKKINKQKEKEAQI